MPKYHYEVLDADGSVRHGEMEGENPERVADELQKKGLVIISINRYGDAAVQKSGMTAVIDSINQRLIMGNGKVKLQTLLQFTTQLASMVGAGLHLIRVVGSLADDTTDKRFKIMLQDIKDSVEGGESFSDALAKYPNTFTTVYVNLVKAAEATGDMDIILNQLAIYLDKTVKLRSRVKSAMTYPVVVLGFAFIAVLVLIIKIVPVFEKTFAKLGADLPLPTLILINISTFMREYFFFTACLFGGTIFIFWRFFHTQHGRYLWDKITMTIPVFGPLIWKSVLTRFLQTLSILLRSGISVLEAFRLAGKASDHKVLEKCVYKCMDDIRDGKPISSAMSETKIFPDIVLRMVSSGEEAGTLPDMLEKITNYFEQQVQATVDALSSIIEPFLIVILGVVIGSIIVAIFMPIFKLGEAIKGIK